ncbi:MAG: hypothetical protein GEU75_06285 [Dehalococcoidia bacterium]|nr:hypothetical protein [Dehalococcoidia bacterium]
MLGQKTCSGIGNKGERCRALALRDSDFCVFHDPAHADAIAEGRRLGGQRRKREGALAAAYDLDGMSSILELRRLLEIATIDTINLENSVARNRVLIAAVLAGAKLIEVGEHEDRIAAIEAALGPRVVKSERRR